MDNEMPHRATELVFEPRASTSSGGGVTVEPPTRVGECVGAALEAVTAELSGRYPSS
jgi:hypothetical protein